MAIVTGFFIPVILVRNLSVETFGAYRLIASLILAGTVLTSFGLQAVMGRYLPDMLAKKQYASANRLFMFSLLTRFASSLLFVLCLWIFKHSIFGFFNFPEIFFILFVPISAILVLILTKRILGTAFLNALMEQHIDNYNNIAYALLKLVLFWLALHFGYGLKGVIIAWMTAEAVSFIHYGAAAFIRSARLTRLSREESSPAVFEGRRYAKFGMFHFMSTNLGIFHDIMIDNFVIAKYLTVGMVGIYGLAGTIVAFATMLDPGKILKNIFSTILIGKYSRDNDLEVIYKGYSFLNKISLFIFIPAVAGLLLISDKLIIYLFNPEYLEAVSVLYILLPFMVFSALHGPVSQVISILEKNHLMLLSVISSIYNLVMDIILVQYFGLKGIAFATGSAMLMLYLIYFFGIRYYYRKINFPFATICKVLVNSTPMALFIFFSRPYILNIYILFLVVFVSAGIYFGTAYMNKLFNEEERLLINQAVKRNVWVF